MKVPLDIVIVVALVAFCLGVGTTCALRWKPPFMQWFDWIENKVAFGIPPAIPV